MARVPGLVPVKTRMHAALGADLAELVYRCFVLDVLDAVAAAARGRARAGLHAGARARAHGGPGPRGVPADPAGRRGPRRAHVQSARRPASPTGIPARWSSAATARPCPWTTSSRRRPRSSAARPTWSSGHREDGGYYLIGLRRAPGRPVQRHPLEHRSRLRAHAGAGAPSRPPRPPAPRVVRRGHRIRPRPPRRRPRTSARRPPPHPPLPRRHLRLAPGGAPVAGTCATRSCNSQARRPVRRPRA